jgi:hypothetical protein
MADVLIVGDSRTRQETSNLLFHKNVDKVWLQSKVKNQKDSE